MDTFAPPKLSECDGNIALFGHKRAQYFKDLKRRNRTPAPAPEPITITNTVIETVEVEKIVEVERRVEVPVDRIVYVDREVPGPRETLERTLETLEKAAKPAEPSQALRNEQREGESLPELKRRLSAELSNLWDLVGSNAASKEQQDRHTYLFGLEYEITGKSRG